MLERAYAYVRGEASRRTIAAALFFAVLTVVVFWGYLLPGNAIVGSDGMGPPADLAMMEAEGSYFSSWRAMSALGHLNFPSPTLSAYYFVSLQWLDLSAVAATQIMIVGSFWLAGFAMYLCAQRILGNFTAAMLAAFAYMFNQVYLSQVTEAHHYFLLGYALFPLLFLCLYNAVNEYDRRTAITIPVLALLYGTMAAPNLILITAVFLILFFALYVPMSRDWSFGRKAYAGAVGVIAVLLILLPTILAKYVSGGTPVLGTAYTIEEAGYYSSYTLFHSFVLAASENTFIFSSTLGQWTFLEPLWPIGPFVAVVVSVVAFCALLLKKRRKLILALIIPAVIFMVVANGPNPPYGEVFTYLFKNVPLMDSIRAYSRFHLLTGFSIAMLLGIVITDIGELRPEIDRIGGRSGRILRRIFINKKFLVTVLAVCLVFPSSAILLGQLRTFEVPDSYIDPYEWVGEQGDDFRIINLPYQQIFYKNYLPHYDGYPNTMTMDVGMYSPTFSTTPYAFGLETKSYWTYVGSTISGHEYGYREMSGLLGGTASVRYFVAQVYASDSEVALFSSLDDLTLAETFEGGSKVYENGRWAPRVHALTSLSLISGDRSAINMAMGSGLVDLSSDGVVLMNQVQDRELLDRLFDQADLIVVPNGDLLQLAWELYPWADGQIVDLTRYGDEHTINSGPRWIVSTADYYAGHASGPTLVTTGANQISIDVTALEAVPHDLLLRAVYGPDAGVLNVTVDGTTVLSTATYATEERSQWIRLENLSLAQGDHTVTLSADGSGRISLEQMAVVPHHQVEDTLDRVGQELGEHGDKVVYLYSGAQAAQWDGLTYLDWLGREGWGIAGSVPFDVTEIARNGTYIYDPNAYGSIALEIGPAGQMLTPHVRGFQDGRTYQAMLSLRYIGGPIGTAVGTVNVYGTSETTGAVVQVYATSLPDTGAPAGVYSNYTCAFHVPEGYSNISMSVAPALGVEELIMDRLSLSNAGAAAPVLSLDVPENGNYVLRVDGMSSSTPYVRIDGTLYPLSRWGEVMEFDLANMTEGVHEVEVGVDGVYSVALAPAGMVSNAPSTQVSFERVSNIEYDIHLTTDGPTWVLVSESYSGLWEAELDGEVLEHVQVNSMVNAYYVPVAGEHDIVVKFKGQEAYGSILSSMLAALVGSMIIMAVIQYPAFRGREEGRPLLTNLLSRWARRGGR